MLTSTSTATTSSTRSSARSRPTASSPSACRSIRDRSLGPGRSRIDVDSWCRRSASIHGRRRRLVGILDELEAICATSPMIGEIGLDHRFVTDPRSRAAQRVVLDSLLDVAVEQRKMVDVHSSGAEAETAAMLRSRRIDRVIMHWYSGDFETLEALIDRGVLFTVGAAVLHSAHVRRIAARIPDDQVLDRDRQSGRPGLAHGTTGAASSAAPHRIRGCGSARYHSATAEVTRACEPQTAVLARPSPGAMERILETR